MKLSYYNIYLWSGEPPGCFQNSCSSTEMEPILLEMMACLQRVLLLTAMNQLSCLHRICNCCRGWVILDALNLPKIAFDAVLLNTFWFKSQSVRIRSSP